MKLEQLKVEAAALLALPRCEDSWRNLDSMAACIRNLLAALREAERDCVRLDWLEQELAKEEREQAMSGAVAYRALFRKNFPITRAAIDATLNAEAKT